MDYREEKQLEMVGKLFKELNPGTAELFRKERDVTTLRGLAIEVEDCFPKTFAELCAFVQDDLDDWVEKYELTLDPPMDKFDYLKREI